jgi:hypothetical protein
MIKPSGKFQTPSSTSSRSSLLDFFPAFSLLLAGALSKTILLSLNTSTKALCVAQLVSSSPEITKAFGSTKFDSVSRAEEGTVSPNPI